MLGYDRGSDVTVPLLRRPSMDPWHDFTCPMSLRDVEPPVGLVLDGGRLEDDDEFVLAVSDAPEDGEEAE